MKRIDIGTILGLIVGFAGILVGNALEGGHIGTIIQPTAALIVFGGTLGATLISFPFGTCVKAAKSFMNMFLNPPNDPAALIEEIVGYAQKARKDGIIALEKDASTASNPFLGRALLLAVDGTDAHTMREHLELELGQTEERGEVEAKVFESAGAYAPTIGIIGAVLGLIHVMANLSDVSKVGAGIAVAFVATIYGVGSANLCFLPAGGKLKLKHRSAIVLHELIIEGALGIQEGLNPNVLRAKLQGFLAHEAKKAGVPVEAKPAKAA